MLSPDPREALKSLLPAPPPRWRGVAIALAAVALLLAAAVGVLQLHSADDIARPVAVGSAR